jgi:hypothetical protein
MNKKKTFLIYFSAKKKKKSMKKNGSKIKVQENKLNLGPGIFLEFKLLENMENRFWKLFLKVLMKPFSMKIVSRCT